MSVTEIARRVEVLKQQYFERDQRHRRVQSVRAGNVELIAPGMFSQEWPKPIIANYIDAAARDIAEAIAPLPAISCNTTDATSEAARKRADKRGRIANYYVEASRLNQTLFTLADQYLTFGMGILRVETNIGESRPHIHVDSPMGAYPEFDRFGNVTGYAKVWREPRVKVAAMFPDVPVLQKDQHKNSGTIELVKWWDKDREVLFVPESSTTLAEIPNPAGRVPVAVALKPSFDDQQRGQFDDILWTYLARAKMAMLKLEAATDAVEAPLALPDDVNYLPVGSRAVVRSRSPEKVRRVNLEVPPTIFAEDKNLQEEIQTGSRHSPIRMGEVGGSTVTGKGVQALLGGFDTQIKTAQQFVGQALQDAIALCFEIDQTVWAGVKKKVFGIENGQPYTIEYEPSKDIAGDYTVDVSYGLMAGLDPNRALVWALQARADKLISRDMVRRSLPVSINAGDEESKIDIEDYRDSLKQAVQATAQALPALAQQGQDPLEVVRPMAELIGLTKKGMAVEDAVLKVWAPPEPPPEIDPVTGQPVQGGPAGQDGRTTIPGIDPATGQVRGAIPGQVKRGGMPDVRMMLAGLTPGGQANLQANVSRRQAI